jgi:RNA polymerase sigma factor (sigma-70 family)
LLEAVTLPQDEDSIEPGVSDFRPEPPVAAAALSELRPRAARAVQKQQRPCTRDARPRRAAEIDPDILLAAKQGARNAHAALVRFYWRSAARVAAAILGPARGDADVEDIVIEVFDYFIANELASFDPNTSISLSSFLHRKVRWRAYDKLRERGESSLLSEPPAATADPERDAIARQLLSQVEGCFDAMPESQREAVVRRLEGAKYQEIADGMGKSVPAVRGLIHRGLRLLRRTAPRVVRQ